MFLSIIHNHSRNAPDYFPSLIDVKGRIWRADIMPRNQKEVAMPVDSILVSAAVVSIFVVFAGVLIWGNFQTESARQGPANRDRKHRSF